MNLQKGICSQEILQEFIVFDGSELDSYPAEASENSFSWVIFEFYYLDNVNVYADCNGDLGGTAFIDDCGVCSGGNSQHTANSDDGIGMLCTRSYRILF